MLPLRASILAVLLATAAPATSHAEAPPAPAAPAPQTLDDKVAAARAAAAAEPPTPQPRMERSSGFWLGGRKAKGGAYYYPLMLVGLGVFGVTAALTIRGLRRAGRNRPSLPTP